MAYNFDVNNNNGADGGAEVMWALRVLLVSIGWTVLADSDGTTYSGSGTQITGPSSGANGLNNSRAWFRITDPDTRREFCIQRGSSGDGYWWIKYSALDKFTTGGGVLDMPTAADEQNVSDGSSTTGAIVFSAANTYQYHLCADDVAPYAFYAIAATDTTGAFAGIFLFEAMLTGSYPVEDADPVVVTAQHSGMTYSSYSAANDAQCAVGWYRMNMTREAWVLVLPHAYTNAWLGVVAPYGLGANANPHSGGEDTVPIPYGRGPSALAQCGWKGLGKLARWLCQDRANMDTLSLTGTIFAVVFDDVTLPWPNVAPILV